MLGPLSFSLAPYVRSSKALSKWLTPFASWYNETAGYKKYGFKYDDLCASQLYLLLLYTNAAQ